MYNTDQEITARQASAVVPLTTFPQAEGVPSFQMIIVVDPSPTIRFVLEMWLERAGFEVRSFADGVAFLRWLATSAATHPPDLILLEIALPYLDGYTIAQRIQANPRLRETALWFVSGEEGILKQLKGRLVGAQGYLSKPFQIQDILAMVTSALGQPDMADDQAAQETISSRPFH